MVRWLGRSLAGPPYIRGVSTVASLRLRTLVILRWMAVTGQTAAIFLVQFALGFTLPLTACISAISASAILNIVVSLRYPATKRLGDREAAFYLAFDIVQLAILLWLTGGLQNPFAILFLAPITISASALTLRSTLTLVSLALLCVTALGIASEPLPWTNDAVFHMPGLYQIGVWAAVVLGLSFSAVYAWRVAQEARNMSAALVATQAVLSREQQLSALGGLAAAAAHELGTPLATISLVAKELVRDTDESDPVAEEAKLLLSESERCREILGRLTTTLHPDDNVIDRTELGTLIHQVMVPYMDDAAAIELHLNAPQGSDGKATQEPQLRRRPEIIYGLGNFVQNAADFARQKVDLYAEWYEGSPEITIVIEDDGPGFPVEILEQLGEPYLTTRPRQNPLNAGDYEGMGLGVFIAKTLLTRTGAEVTFSNRANPQSGARVEINWPEGIWDDD